MGWHLFWRKTLGSFSHSFSLKTIFLFLSVFLFGFKVFPLEDFFQEEKTHLLKQKSENIQDKQENLEKIDEDELEPYYIDAKATDLVLHLLDDDIIEKELEAESKTKSLEERSAKIITEAGNLPVSESSYAQSMIQKYIRQFTTSYGKKALTSILDDGEVYRLYVRQELKKRNMPKILEYLPVVESEYKVKAVSKSGATGLWQFMENSMYPFLEKSDFVDERLDPWKSTDAALSKLQDNYRVFNDWFLAIAAYNCGSGAMQRILSGARHKDFWYIAEKGLLRDESINYIPKLIAISELSEHGEEYAIELPEITKSTRYAEFDYITTRKSISLKRLAGELRIDYEILRQLNTALVKERTPEKEEYEIRLPLGMEKSAMHALSEILKDEQ